MLNKIKLREYLHSISNGQNIDFILNFLRNIDAGVFDTRTIQKKHSEFITDSIDIIEINLTRADIEYAMKELEQLKEYIKENEGE